MTTTKNDVVDLAEARRRRREYRKQLHRTAHALRTMQVQLHDMTTSLALLAGLDDALADLPVGAVVRINSEMLIGVGDPHVSALATLGDSIDVVVAKLYDQDSEK